MVKDMVNGGFTLRQAPAQEFYSPLAELSWIFKGMRVFV